MSVIGVLHTGEMGAAVGRLLLHEGRVVVTCAEGRTKRTRTAAEEAGVELLAGYDDVLARSSVVISLVPPAAALTTAHTVADAAVRSGGRPLYVDANSLSPATMANIEKTVARAGLECVDGAFVGSSAKLGAETTLYVSGRQAGRVRELLGPAFRVEALGDEIGSASGFKLAFACFNKGLVALFLEVMAAADHLGRRDELLAALRSFYAGSVETVERLLPTYPVHATRRADELAEATLWLRGIGQSGLMAGATHRVIAQLAGLGLSVDADWDAERLLAEYCNRVREGD